MQSTSNNPTKAEASRLRQAAVCGYFLLVAAVIQTLAWVDHSLSFRETLAFCLLSAGWLIEALNVYLQRDPLAHASMTVNGAAVLIFCPWMFVAAIACGVVWAVAYLWLHKRCIAIVVDDWAFASPPGSVQWHSHTLTPGEWVDVTRGDGDDGFSLRARDSRVCSASEFYRNHRPEMEEPRDPNHR